MSADGEKSMLGKRCEESENQPKMGKNNCLILIKQEEDSITINKIPDFYKQIITNLQ